MPKILEWENFFTILHSIANISSKFLLNWLFYRFHARQDDSALDRASFPVNGHLHTNRKSFPT